jgi:Na+/phosphate symporter
MMILQAIAIVVGVLMYALSANPKLQECGRIMFAAGIFSFLLTAHTLPYVH